MDRSKFRGLLLISLIAIAAISSGCAEAVGKGLKAFLKSSVESGKIIKPLTKLSQAQIEKYRLPTTQEGVKNMAKEMAKRIDYTNPIVRDLAVRLASKYPGERNIMQVQAIYEYVYRNWKYVSDPRGFEYYAYASETIRNNFAGDCDDYAILMSALVKAVGFSPRIIIACDKSSCHAYPEVYIGKGSTCEEITNSLAKKFKDTVYYHTTSSGECWLSLDWTSNHIGSNWLIRDEIFAIYPDGSYVIYE